jgi:hypothetical protein
VDFTAIFVVFIMFGMPIIALTTISLAVPFGLAAIWHHHKGRELKIRALEATSRLHEARLLAGAPEFVDPNCLADIDAWRRAQSEVFRTALEARSKIAVG